MSNLTLSTEEERQLDLFVQAVPAASLTYRLVDELPFDNSIKPKLSMVEDVRVFGVIQPIALSQDGDKIEVIAGKRRLAAAREAGLAEVPCIIYASADVGRVIAVLSAVENNQRSANHVTNFQSVQSLAEKGHSEATIAKHLRMTLPSARAYLRAAAVHDDVLDAFVAGKVKWSVVRLTSTYAPSKHRALAPLLKANGTITAKEVRELLGTAEPTQVKTPGWWEGALAAVLGQAVKDAPKGAKGLKAVKAAYAAVKEKS